MLVKPLPGADRELVFKVLREVATDLGNVTGRATQASERFELYIRWVNDSVRRLRNLVSEADVERLLLTKRYWLLQEQSSIAGGPHDWLLTVEIDDRVAALAVANAAFESMLSRWSRAGLFVVLDTSFFIEHAEKFEDVRLAVLVHSRDKPIHVLVPMTIVDELDGLKRSKDKHVRWRASHSLAVIDRVASSGALTGELRAADYSRVDDGVSPEGAITVEVVLDPPGHQRLAIADDEIIDRTLAIQGGAGRELTLLTYDTGQSMRARSIGLKVIRLWSSQDVEPAPAP
jgi:hypothetical protein